VPVELVSSPRQHLGYIDALRGLAIAAVIAVHVASLEHVVGIAGSALAFGAKGVQLFYIVSALTLMMSMNKRGQERNATLNFFLRRFFRIAPVFYLALLLYCILGWKFTSSGILPTPLPRALLIASFLNGWRPDTINAPVTGQWSIAVEMMFYLLLSQVFPLLNSFRRAVCGWWLSVLLYLGSNALAVRVAAGEGFSAGEAHDFAYWWFPAQLPIFLCGIGVFYIVSERRSLWQSMLPYLAGAAMVLAVHRFHPDVGLLPLVGAALMAGVVLLSRTPVKLLVNPWTRSLGRVSFSAYLCHPLLLPAIHALLGRLAISHVLVRFALSYGIVLAAAWSCAWCMFRWIEEPFQRLGRRLIERIEADDSDEIVEAEPEPIAAQAA
jgi:peptidoglycan/LPS O-acetylase OafA/YrhL